MRKAVIVNFDGVILKNSIANKYISSSIKTYVQCKLQTTNKSIIDTFSKRVNSDYTYTEHGYSGLAEFNYHVYDSCDAKMKYNMIQMTPEETGEWYRFKEICDTHGVEVLIHTNATINWVRNFIPQEHNHTLVLCEYLENFSYVSDPSIKSTIMINFIKEKYSKAFLIDTTLNSLIVNGNSFYTRIWFDSTISCDSHILLNPGFYAINNLEQIGSII